MLQDPQKTKSLEENLKKGRELEKKVEDFRKEVQNQKLTYEEAVKKKNDLSKESERLYEERLRLFKRTTSFAGENDPDKGLLAKSFTPAASGVSLPSQAAIAIPRPNPNPRQTLALTV